MKVDMGTIISQDRLSEGIYSMWIKTDIAREAKAGQFVAVYPKDGSRLLQRPISLCEINDDSIRIVYRVAGKGTDEFSSYKGGDEIRLLGPCGNGFTIEESKRAFLVGGGIGIPPMLQLGKELKAKGIDFSFVLGYRNDDMFLIDDFKSVGDVIIATDDGSVGTHGTVVDAIKESDSTADIIYSCGPMPMLRALKGYAGDMNMKAYISLEERMACGVGACLGCVCKTTKKDEHSHVNNARVCIEGPVFDAEDVNI